MSEAESLTSCEAAFVDDLQGHPLLSNRSTWFRYTIVKNANWYSTMWCSWAMPCIDRASVDRLGDSTRDARCHCLVRSVAVGR